jgi:hypothetical protein
MEVIKDGSYTDEVNVFLKFKGVMLCLEYGLIDVENMEFSGDYDQIPSAHLSLVSKAIFNKALTAEKERTGQYTLTA